MHWHLYFDTSFDENILPVSFKSIFYTRHKILHVLENHKFHMKSFRKNISLSDRLSELNSREITATANKV